MGLIVVVGSINSDLVVSASRIPQPGETILGNGFAAYPGGKGANQAVAVAKLGHPCSMIGKLGRDGFGADLRSQLVKAGVDTAAVGDADGPSGVALITTGADGENSIVVVSGANALLTSADIDANRDLIHRASIVLVQLETPLETVARLAEVAGGNNVPVMLDPAPARELPTVLLDRLAWITPNSTETGIILGTGGTADDAKNAPALAEALLARGPRGVVLKMGAHGAYLATSDGYREHVPAFKVTAVDTTAAGDAFNGGFAVGLAQGMKPAEAARFASAVAAISVTRKGAQPSMPTLSEVEDFLRDRE
jgi:ribokinase